MVTGQPTKDGERRLTERKMEKKDQKLEKKLKHKFGGERAQGRVLDDRNLERRWPLPREEQLQFYQAKDRRSRSGAKASLGTATTNVGDTRLNP